MELHAAPRTPPPLPHWLARPWARCTYATPARPPPAKGQRGRNYRRCTRSHLVPVERPGIASAPVMHWQALCASLSRRPSYEGMHAYCLLPTFKADNLLITSCAPHALTSAHALVTAVHTYRAPPAACMRCARCAPHPLSACNESNACCVCKGQHPHMESACLPAAGNLTAEQGGRGRQGMGRPARAAVLPRRCQVARGHLRVTAQRIQAVRAAAQRSEAWHSWGPCAAHW